MKPFGPFDAVGAIALEIERMSGFAQGQRDFAAGKVEDWPDPEIERTPVEEARFKGYWDGWTLAYSAHCKRLTAKPGIEVEEIPTIEATAPWDFITTDGAKE